MKLATPEHLASLGMLEDTDQELKDIESSIQDEVLNTFSSELSSTEIVSIELINKKIQDIIQAQENNYSRLLTSLIRAYIYDFVLSLFKKSSVGNKAEIIFSLEEKIRQEPNDAIIILKLRTASLYNTYGANHHVINTIGRTFINLLLDQLEAEGFLDKYLDQGDNEAMEDARKKYIRDFLQTFRGVPNGEDQAKREDITVNLIDKGLRAKYLAEHSKAFKSEIILETEEPKEQEDHEKREVANKILKLPLTKRLVQAAAITVLSAMTVLGSKSASASSGITKISSNTFNPPKSTVVHQATPTPHPTIPFSDINANQNSISAKPAIDETLVPINPIPDKPIPDSTQAVQNDVSLNLIPAGDYATPQPSNDNNVDLEANPNAITNATAVPVQANSEISQDIDPVIQKINPDSTSSNSNSTFNINQFDKSLLNDVVRGHSEKFVNFNITNQELLNNIGNVALIHNGALGTKFLAPQKGYAGQYHQGIDIAGEGAVMAPANMEIVYIGNVYGYTPTGGLGSNGFIARSPKPVYQINGEDLYAYYVIGHMKLVGDNIKAATTLQAGDYIGEAGALGNAEGVHVHFEIHLGPKDSAIIHKNALGVAFVVFDDTQVITIDPEPIFYDAIHSASNKKSSTNQVNSSGVLQAQLDNYDVQTFEFPSLFEGYYTRYGPSSNCIASFKIQTDQLLWELNNGRLNESDLTNNQRRILELRKIFNQDEIKYTNHFNKFLKSQGYDGCIALKSINDFGKVGFIQIWNPVSETWNGPYKVIVLDAANNRTFGTIKNTQRNVPGTNTFMKWGFDMSDEVTTLAGLANNAEGGFARWSQDIPLTQNLNINFPNFDVPKQPISEDLIRIGSNFKGRIGQFNYRLVTLLPITKQIFTFQGLSNDHYLDENFFLPYLFKSETQTFLKSGNSLNNISTITAFDFGFPTDKQSQYKLFNYFYQNGILNRQIITSGKTPNGLNQGVFFLTTRKSVYSDEKVITTGILINNNGTEEFVFYTGNKLNIVSADTMIGGLTNYGRILVFN